MTSYDVRYPLTAATAALPLPDTRRELTTLTFVCAAVAYAFAFATGSMLFPLSAWLAALLYGYFFIRMLKIAPSSAVLLLGHFGLYAATQFISGIAIEHGGYLSETEQFGSPTGGFMRLAAVYILFYGTAAIIIESFIRHWAKQGKIALFMSNEVTPPPLLVTKLVDAVIIAALAYVTVVAAINGFPLLTGEDHYDFAKLVGGPAFVSVINNREPIMAYIGFMIAYTKRPLFYVAMALYIIILSAFLGDKFGIYWAMIPLLVLPSLLKTAWRAAGLPIRKIVILGATLSVITLPLVFFIYGGLDDAQAGLTRMADRMTLQGQLWFLADREVDDLWRFESAALANDWRLIMTDEYDPTSYAPFKLPYPLQGMSYLILHFSRFAKAYETIRHGTVYCLGLHAYLLEILGWLGMLAANFLLAGLLGLFLSGMAYGIIEGRLVYLLVFAKLTLFFGSMVSMADFYQFLNPRSFGLFLFLIAYHTLTEVPQSRSR
jgi:hypothetical protein